MSSDDEANNQEAMDKSTNEVPSKASAAASLLTPPGKSPPGMKLRSGRKKRRRSKETTGLTPPEEKRSPKRKRAALKRDKEEEDEEMEEEEEEDGKAVKAATDAAAAAIADGDKMKKAKKQVPPIEKLRMPSQHTPGQKKAASSGATAAETTTTTAAASSSWGTVGAPPSLSGAYAGTRRLLFGAPAPPPKDNTPASEELESILANPPLRHEDPSPATPSGRHDALPKNLVRRTSDILVDFTTTIQEVTTTLVVPQPERLQVHGEEEKEHSSISLDRPLAWIVILLVLQLLMSMAIPFGFNPVMSVLVGLSNVATGFYQGILGRPLVMELVEEQILVETEVVESVDEPSENPLLPLMKSLDVSMESMRTNTTMLQAELDAVQESLQSRNQRYKKVEALLDTAEKSVGNVLSSLSEGRTNVDVRGARLILSKLETALGTSFSLIDSVDVPLWDDSPVPCQAASPTSQDAILTQDELEVQKHDLRERARNSAKLLQTDPDLSESVKKWINGRVKEIMEQTKRKSASNADASPAAINVGLTSQDVQKVIEKRLEVELADQLGRIDYASLGTGASIIRSGPRATSPSLVDNLPLVNRLATSWRLRFYGHGPEAALTPTLPSDALGQCWSFEHHGAKETDDSNGKFGTLSIRLPKPLTVTSVAMEHAPKELSKQVTSATRDFRVFGYEDDKAMGRPWLLGNFRYNVDHERVLQEWETETISREGVPIPKVRSITLAVDNNYGFEYTCLYRFRVHGDP